MSKALFIICSDTVIGKVSARAVHNCLIEADKPCFTTQLLISGSQSQPLKGGFIVKLICLMELIFLKFLSPKLKEFVRAPTGFPSTAIKENWENISQDFLKTEISRINSQNHELTVVNLLNSHLDRVLKSLDKEFRCRQSMDLVSIFSGNTKIYGFEAICKREPSVYFEIDRHVIDREALPKTYFLEGKIPTNPFILVNHLRILVKACGFVNKVLGGNEKYSFSLRQKIGRSPQGQDIQIEFPILRFLFRYAQTLLSRCFNKYVRAQRTWHVGFGYFEKGTRLQASKPVILDNPSSGFYADPFPWSDKSGSYTIFLEDFSYASKKGSISYIEVKDGLNFGKAKNIINEPFHLSFPHLFEYRGELFLLPESSAAHEIRLYRCLSYPDQWVFNGVLINGVQAVDTVLVEKDEFWWLFTTLDTSQLGDLRSELHLFYSKTPTSASWTPHPLNPIVFDPEQARCAGSVFWLDGNLYRVFQRHGFDQYGADFGVARIMTVTTTEYKEVVDKKILRSFRDAQQSIHTVNLVSESAYCIDIFK